MGPRVRYLGPDVPKEELVWQDPLPEPQYETVDDTDIEILKAKLLESKLTISDLVTTAWSSASTFRGSDMRGGANGARLRLSPQKYWSVNEPQKLSNVLDTLEAIRNAFNESQSGKKTISLADMIVLGGCAAIESAANKAGHDITVPFTPGRVDASQDQTDVESFKPLEPEADGFRNYLKSRMYLESEHMLIDRAQLLTLTAPEMTVLLGGLRVLDTNYEQSNYGVFTDRPGVLSNDFFVNLLDLGIQWSALDPHEQVFQGKDRKTGEHKWTGTRVDLIFGSNSELRAITEVYGSADAEKKFLNDFVAAWNKVMNLDRFDLKLS